MKSDRQTPRASVSQDSEAAFKAWLIDVDRVMKSKWKIDTVDAGLSKDDLIEFWTSFESPELFVKWYAEKYDLIDFDFY